MKFTLNSRPTFGIINLQPNSEARGHVLFSIGDCLFSMFVCYLSLTVKLPEPKPD